MPREDRAVWVAEIIDAAVEAVETGHPRKADQILTKAVHVGITPAEFVVELTNRDPVTATDVAPPVAEEGKPVLVTYVGPGPGVHLSPANGDLWCPAGVPVEVPARVGHALVEQPTFTSGQRRQRRRRETPERAPAGETPESPDPTMEARPDGTEST